MYFAVEQMCLGNDELALTLHEDGRHFDGLPFFEQYRHDPEDNPEVDYSSAGGDLLKMMQLDAEVTKDRQHHDGFVRVPFDYYEELQQKMVDMMPDFRVRLKVNPKTRKMVFAADVHSVFDICWYTLARKCPRMLLLRIRARLRIRKKSLQVLLCPVPSAVRHLYEEATDLLSAGNRNVKRQEKR